MMMNHLYLDAYGDFQDFSPFILAGPPGEAQTVTNNDVDRVFIADKFECPDISRLVRRQRIDEILDRSVRNYTGTLISGRAGTGKSSAAALFAAHAASFSWYSADASDCDAGIFIPNLIASITGSELEPEKLPEVLSAVGEITSIPERAIAEMLNLESWPELIIVDNIHHLFDMPWFDVFFSSLIASIPDGSHLIMTCRSKPASPLWRMRSKQVLNLIEEKLLYFSSDEARELYASFGIGSERAFEHQKLTFGHPLRLIRLIA